MKNKIIHISIDSQFVNITKSIFELISDFESKFLVLIPILNFRKRLINHNNLIKINYHFFNLFSHLLIKKDTIVFLHQLNIWNAKFILKNEKKYKILLCTWGGDLIKNNYLGNKTKNKVTLFRKLYDLINNNINHFIDNDLIIKKALKKVKYISMHPSEFKYYSSNNFLHEDVVYFHYHYVPIEILSKKINIQECNLTNNIILGKSGKPEEEHVKILNLLSKRGLKVNKIHLNLSYGDRAYINNLEELTKNLKFNFSIVKKFESSENYFSNLTSPSNVIFGHLRQMGFSNALVFLYMGKKLFLREDSFLYKELSKKGLKIFSIDKELNQFQLNSCLTENDIRYNQNLVIKEFGVKNILKELKKVLK